LTILKINTILLDIATRLCYIIAMITDETRNQKQTEVVMVTNLYQYNDLTHTLTDGRIATITSLYASKHATPGGIVNCVEGVIDGNKYMINIDNKPSLRDAISAEISRRKADLLARVPGLCELEAARNADYDYHQGVQNMMGDESNDGVRPPKRPATTAAEVAAKYPEAVAYLHIIAYADAQSASNVGFNRRCAAKLGIVALNNGSTPTEAKKIMDAAFEAAEKNSPYND